MRDEEREAIRIIDGMSEKELLAFMGMGFCIPEPCRIAAMKWQMMRNIYRIAVTPDSSVNVPSDEDSRSIAGQMERIHPPVLEAVA